MSLKIMLHGATNCNSSNYGDYIYADMICHYLAERKIGMHIFQPSDFFKKYLKKYNILHKLNPLAMDALVYIPGGYFGEGHKAQFKDNIIHWLRFMPIGILAAMLNKPIAILGIGAGPLNSRILRSSVKYICNHAELVTARDSYSFKTLKDLCPNRDYIKESFDLILTNQELKNHTYVSTEECAHRTLLVHYNHSVEALEKFAEAVKIFTNKHPEYRVIVSSDQILKNDEELFKKFKRIVQTANCIYHRYSSPEDMTSLIGISDLILTTKLHVGVVGALLGKSVISIPCHPEKTIRFYHAIHEDSRCLSLFEATPADILEIMESNYSHKIEINNDLVVLADLTWKLFDKFIAGVR